jgi:antitoxin MazE
MYIQIKEEMEISVVKIGNSKGIRLSKTLLERYNIKDSVELIMEKGYMIIKPKEEIRKGWGEAFRAMHEEGDDRALMSDVFEDESFEEWK